MSIKLGINYISLIIIFAISFTTPSESFAAKKSKKKTSDAPEVYSATEEDSPGAPSLYDKGVWENEKLKVKTEPLKGGMMTSEDDVEIPIDPKNAVPRKINDFDPVDPKQIDAITSRMRLIEQIIRKHKRAYDYRYTTTLELVEMLKYLDKTAAAGKK